MPAKTHGERLDRLEEVVGILAESQLSLEKTVAELATETRRGFDQVAAQFEIIGNCMAETDERMRQTDERMRQTDGRIREVSRENAQRSRELDGRVDKLVLAIGELIRNQNAPRP